MTTTEPTDPQEPSTGPFSKFRDRVEEFNRMLRDRAIEVEQSVRSGIKSKLPEDAVEHLSNSKREFLLFVRKVVDRELERTDSKPGDSADPVRTDDTRPPHP